MHTDSPRGGNPYTYESGLRPATERFFRRYTDFSGRSNRGDFWWWVLANIGITIGLGIVESIVGLGGENWGVLTGLWSLATIVPSLALGARRLHDIDRSGWWQLLVLIPLIGFLVLLYWFIQRPDPQPNRFG